MRLWYSKTSKYKRKPVGEALHEAYEELEMRIQERAAELAHPLWTGIRGLDSLSQ